MGVYGSQLGVYPGVRGVWVWIGVREGAWIMCMLTYARRGEGSDVVWVCGVCQESYKKENYQ